MTAAELIADLDRRGIRLAANGDRLRVEGPLRLLDDGIRAELVAYKAELLAVLSADWTGAAAALLARFAGKTPGQFSQGLAEQFEERAGIVEYDGNLTRQKAEQIAYEQIADEAELRFDDPCDTGGRESYTRNITGREQP